MGEIDRYYNVIYVQVGMCRCDSGNRHYNKCEHAGMHINIENMTMHRIHVLTCIKYLLMAISVSESEG